MPVPILIYQIFRGLLAERAEPLRTPRPHPNEVAGRDRIPRIAEPVNPAAFEHQQPVLHHVHFDHAQRRSRLVHHRVDREIEAHRVRKQALHLQVRIVARAHCEVTASSLDRITLGGFTDASG